MRCRRPQSFTELWTQKVAGMFAGRRLNLNITRLEDSLRGYARTHVNVTPGTNTEVTKGDAMDTSQLKSIHDDNEEEAKNMNLVGKWNRSEWEMFVFQVWRYWTSGSRVAHT